MGFEELSPRLHVYRDLCNVYVLTSGPRALLIDVGSGDVLDRLGELGVEQVDWVLHTHHHRDQCQGDRRAIAAGARIAVPAREAAYFDDAEGSWQRQQILDLYECTNVFDRPLQNVPVAARLGDYDTFEWADLALTVLPTPGHTKGSITLIAELDGTRWAFCGDLLYSPGRVWTLYDLHWDYSNPDALDAELHSLHVLRRERPDRLAPSHGEVMTDPDAALVTTADRLAEFTTLVGQGFVGDIRPPLAVAHRFERLSEHLLAVTSAMAHVFVLLDGNGAALLFDYGFPSFQGFFTGAGSRFVEHTLPELREQFGVDRFEVLVPTHYHNDHVAGAGFLQRRYGTEVWVHESFADVLERPGAYRIPAVWSEPISVDRVLTDGEQWEWRGYRFTGWHCPGHTWYAAAYFGEVDGRRIAVTGDEIQLDIDRALRGGGPVFRNRMGLGDFAAGVRRTIEYEPELLLTGHDGAIEVGRAELDEVHRWSCALDDAFVSLAALPDAVGFALDPDWVRFDPYLATGRAGDGLPVAVELRNHLGHDAQAHLRPVLPDGWRVEPEELSLSIAAESSGRAALTLLPPADAQPGVRHIVALDVELDGRRYGQRAETLVTLAA
jgi:glyoxylase-like metal-dependent hydrolase (beta-lactamase superfamily II)